MPTATEFTALGAGNGFALCLSSIDITDRGFQKWITLGGNRKGGSVTESGKGLAQAMQFYWNLEGFRFSASASASNGQVSVSTSLTDYSSDADSSRKIIPMHRVCESLRDISVSDYDVNAPLGSSSVFGFTTWNGFNEIYRYYNGVTSNEDNFVGYGFALDTTGFGQDQEISLQAGAFGANAGVNLASGSYSTNDNYVSVPSNISLNFHFVGSTSDSDSNTNAQAQVSFNSLDFYTY